MLRPQSLSVRPVTRSRVPGYPGHLDPNPLYAGRPVAYPFGPRTLALTAAIAAASSSGCGSTVEEAGPAAPEADPKPALPKIQPPPLAGEPPEASPFTLHHSGLPHMPSSFGTGMPSYISEARARDAIEQVFEANGYALERGVAISEGELEFTATGYDADHRIGYVFAAYHNLASDAFQSWSGFSGAYRDVDHLYWNIYARHTPRQVWPEWQIQPHISNEQEFADLREKSVAFSTELQTRRLEKHYGVSDEARERITDEVREIVARGEEHIERAIHDDIRNSVTEYLFQKRGPGPRVVPAATATESIGARVDEEFQRHERKLTVLFEAENILRDEQARQVINESLQEMAEQDRPLLSMREMSRLQELGEEGKKFVAVISQHDRRLLLPGRLDWSHDEEAIEREYRIALRKLEESVADYIAWARSQGVQ